MVSVRCIPPPSSPATILRPVPRSIGGDETPELGSSPVSGAQRQQIDANCSERTEHSHLLVRSEHVLRPQRQVGNAIEAQKFVSAAVSVSRASSTGAITPDFPSAVMMRLIFIVKVFVRKKVRKAKTVTVNTRVTSLVSG